MENPDPPGPQEPAITDDPDDPLDPFRAVLNSLRDLGQTLGPSSMLPMLTPYTDALRRLAGHLDPVQSREALYLAARFAEYTGWMTQATADDVAALRWTDQAVELARVAGDEDLIAYAYIRRANIALYQQDSYGTISFARRATQTMKCSRRVKGLALLREA